MNENEDTIYMETWLWGNCSAPTSDIEENLKVERNVYASFYDLDMKNVA